MPANRYDRSLARPMYHYLIIIWRGARFIYSWMNVFTDCTIVCLGIADKSSDSIELREFSDNSDKALPSKSAIVQVISKIPFAEMVMKLESADHLIEFISGAEHINMPHVLSMFDQVEIAIKAVDLSMQQVLPNYDDQPLGWYGLNRCISTRGYMCCLNDCPVPDDSVDHYIFGINFKRITQRGNTFAQFEITKCQLGPLSKPRPFLITHRIGENPGSSTEFIVSMRVCTPVKSFEYRPSAWTHQHTPSHDLGYAKFKRFLSSSRCDDPHMGEMIDSIDSSTIIRIKCYP